VTEPKDSRPDLKSQSTAKIGIRTIIPGIGIETIGREAEVPIGPKIGSIG
jgi:hypothetical protein